MSLLALALWAAAAHAAPAAPARDVVRSTAPLSATPADIPGLKRRIQLDQDDVQKTRVQLKKALKGKDPKSKTKAREDWLAAKERLKADRAALRQAIEAQEEEHRTSEKLREALKQGDPNTP